MKNLFRSTYFRSDFRQIFDDLDARNFKIVEAVVNLFLELHALKLTKLDGLGIKRKGIKLEI